MSFVTVDRLDDVEFQERELEHSLATAFCAMQRTTDAGERQRGWLECLRLCAELEKLNGPTSES